MSDTKEAWEHIAGELPPGANEIHMSRREVVFLNERWWGVDANAKAWAHWEYHSQVTCRAYAELIAPQRVREAAERAFDEPFFIAYSYWDSDKTHAIRVSPKHGPGSRDHCGLGQDICSAAWAAIQAMTVSK